MPFDEQEKKLSQYLKDHPDLRAAIQGHDQRIAGSFDIGTSVTEEESELLQVKANSFAREAIRRATNRRRARVALTSIAAALVILIAATPQGRALAKNTYHTIASLVHGILHVRTQSPSSSMQIYPFKEVKPASFANIEDAEKYLDMALICVQNKDFLPETVTVDSSEAFMCITSNYMLPKGDGFYIAQSLYPAQDGWGASLDVSGKDPFTIQLYNGETMYCGYTQEGAVVGIAHWNNMELYITSATMKWDTLLKYVQMLGETK